MNDFFVIRFAVCAEKANDKDIGKFGVAIVILVIVLLQQKRRNLPIWS